ncbi:hypothetical protein FACS1894123_02810 [Bacteroidia bacterium]|nr:hypothetical protein FACS1894123_02810 [Bacteroidia bacterium]
MKIAISGTYSTGKTTTAIALSLLTSIQSTHARTMREILPAAYPGKRLEKCNFQELIELGMRRFTERIFTEKQQGDCFISDGCPLQEWIYGTTKMLTGLNSSENQWKIKLHKTMYSSDLKIDNVHYRILWSKRPEVREVLSIETNKISTRITN